MSNDINESLECSICFSDLNQPKLLPCMHTFCLKCLEHHCQEEIDGDMKPCPLCRTEFCIPQGGIEKLPDNPFVTRLLSIDRGKSVEKKLGWYGPCSETKSQEMPMAMISTCCSIHKVKEMEFYCCDCKIPLCSICYFQNHRNHICKLLTEVVQQRKECLAQNDHIFRILHNINCDQLGKHETERERILHEVHEAYQSIEITFNNLVRHITNLKEKLKQNLHATLAKRMEDIDRNEDLFLRQNTMLNEFLERNKLLLERGTDCEIVRVADDLHKRAEELIKSQDERNKQQLPNCCVKFTPAPAPTLEDIESLIGRVCLSETGTIEYLTNSATQSLIAPPSYNSCNNNNNMTQGITVSSDTLSTQPPTPPPCVPLFYGISPPKDTTGPTIPPIIQPPTPPSYVPNFYNLPPVTDELNPVSPISRRAPHYSSFQSNVVHESPPVSAVYPKLRPPIPAKRSSVIDRFK